MDPIRCTCGKVIAQLFPKYRKLLEQGYTKKEILRVLNIKKNCCKIKILCNVNIIDEIIKFDKEKLIKETLEISNKYQNIDTDELYKRYTNRIKTKAKRVYTLS